MYPSQVIGIGNGKRVDLLCSVEEIIPGGIKFYVINGNWYGTLTGNTLTCFAPFGNTTHSASILYTGSLPSRRAWEYQESMNYINDRLNGWTPVWWYSITSRIRLETSRITNAFGAGFRAFGRAWNINKPHTSPEYHEVDDDIPF